ncbi:hypothetical protein SCLCIDRAFT_27075 [Scleroderma citrinum Foug A]|uniref:Retrotransposon gag domain-containing protein n=1 Tax=Scleroderma citrinum Foug A TaxID=1036808 RepID=A0A0C3DGK3_9AGAM|nr:hypothetical protein SCLCIDRAFT_27075 [Scleroderma citrinum Foug A]
MTGSPSSSEQVGEEPFRPLGPEVKAMIPPKPGKYGRQDDIEKFNDWLTQLLKYFRTFKVTRYGCDMDRVLYTGLYLKDITAKWYDQEVESPDRCINYWSFKDLICGLFKRFIHEATTQQAMTNYDRMCYSAEKGALAFFNDMKQHAHHMVEPPDDYLFRRKFIGGLSHSIIKTVLEAPPPFYKAPQARLYAVDVCEDEEDTLRNKEIGEVHPTDLTDESTNDAVHNVQEDEEHEVEPLDTYSEEEDGDELIRYLGAMRPVEELNEPDDEHVIQCCSMQLHNKGDDLQDAALELTPVPSADEGAPPSLGPDGA